METLTNNICDQIEGRYRAQIKYSDYISLIDIYMQDNVMYVDPRLGKPLVFKNPDDFFKLLKKDEEEWEFQETIFEGTVKVDLFRTAFGYDEYWKLAETFSSEN